MSGRRFSVTLSEDDLRPHMRKPKPKPSTPSPLPPRPLFDFNEIEELKKKAEKREEVKKEVKRRVEEEEKERERQKGDDAIRRETHELLAIRDVVGSRANNNSNGNGQPSSSFMPRLGRRVNNFQYFRWDSDEEIPVIPDERLPSRARSTVPPPSTVHPPNVCELCTLALRSVDRSGGPTKSAACAHVDAFVAATSVHHYHH